MKSNMLGRLEDAIQKWINSESDKYSDDWVQLDFWCPDEIVELMAKSASAVFDIAVQSSIYTKEAENDTKI